jgi:hypothetical protein
LIPNQSRQLALALALVVSAFEEGLTSQPKHEHRIAAPNQRAGMDSGVLQKASL